MFKIIAIETLEPEADMKAILETKEKLVYRSPQWERLQRFLSVMKTLKYPKVYTLFNNYDISNTTIVKRIEPVVESLYSSGPDITFSAIVAENGGGKSSLIELMLRVIFNCACVLQHGIYSFNFGNSKRYYFARDIYARIYFETDAGDYMYLEQKDMAIKMGRCNSNEVKFDYVYPSLKGSNVAEDRKILASLFYAIEVNYSAYALNEYDIPDEWIERTIPRDKNGVVMHRPLCWLSSIFEKNDAYQMPILIAPYRNNGQFNVNREKTLLIDRLYSLLLDSDKFVNVLFNGKKIKYLNIKPDEVVPLKSRKKVSKKFDDICAEFWSNVNNKSKSNVIKNIDLSYKKQLYSVIVDAWCSECGLNGQIMKNQYWNVSLQYIAYKTIKIALRYAKYSEFIRRMHNLDVADYIRILNSDQSHITLKIRRCLALLVFGSPIDKYGTVLQDGSFRIPIKDYCKWMQDSLKNQSTICAKNGCNDKRIWKQDELWPAPCFKAEVEFAATDNAGIERVFRHSSLSSGEKQIINIVTLVLYHIKNIQSAHWRNETDMVSYKDVLLIFDELELYFHPRYQQMLVRYLWQAIKTLGIDNEIHGIHIIMATHSPFILSDIPSNNMLCLEQGNVKNSNILGETFAANIYDILNNKFFLNSFVGEFASDIIDDIVGEIQMIESGELLTNVDCLLKKIDIIGDDFVRTNLRNQVLKKCGETIRLRAEKKHLQKRLLEIDAKLNDSLQ